jgi:hypothetical protein
MKNFLPIECLNKECTTQEVIVFEAYSRVFDLTYGNFESRMYCNHCWTALMSN